MTVRNSSGNRTTLSQEVLNLQFHQCLLEAMCIYNIISKTIVLESLLPEMAHKLLHDILSSALEHPPVRTLPHRRTFNMVHLLDLRNQTEPS